MGGFEAVDPQLEVLYRRALDVLQPDPRVKSVSPGGSIAVGTADEWSDLDLHIVATEDGFETLLAEWPMWLAEITPTVFARTPIAPFIINTVTDTGLTFDVVVYKGAPLVFPTPTGYAVGALSGQRFDDIADALEYAVEEQLRGMAGPFVSLVQRDEHVKHLTGVPHLLGLLTTVFLAETGRPAPGKRWNESFTDEQLQAVAALPPVAATRDDIIAFGMAVAHQVVSRGRPLFERYEREWPAALARVAADRVRSSLGIDTTDWLY